MLFVDKIMCRALIRVERLCKELDIDRACMGLFSMALVIWTLSHMLQESVFGDTSSTLIKTLRVVSFLLLAFLEFLRFSSYDRKDWIFATLLVPFAISGVVAHNTVLFQGLVFCFSARRNIKVEDVLKVIVIAISVTLFIVVFLSQIGVLDTGSLSATMGGGVRFRSSLGFAWPSRAPNYFLTIVLLFILIFRGVGVRRKLILAIGLYLFALLIFSATDSRAPTLLTLVAITGFILLREGEKKPTKKLAVIVSTAFIVCLVGLVVLTVLYSPDNKFSVHLNALLSGRLRYSQLGIANYSLTLFGSSQINLGDPSVSGYFDSGYLRMLYLWGAIPSIVFLGGISLTLYKAMVKGDFPLSFVLVLLAIHSTIEGRLVLLNYSPFLLYMGPAVFGEINKIVVKHASRKSEKQ